MSLEIVHGNLEAAKTSLGEAAVLSTSSTAELSTVGEELSEIGDTLDQLSRRLGALGVRVIAAGNAHDMSQTRVESALQNTMEAACQGGGSAPQALASVIDDLTAIDTVGGMSAERLEAMSACDQQNGALMFNARWALQRQGERVSSLNTEVTERVAFIGEVVAAIASYQETIGAS